jgi:hypothetical protein
MLAPGMRLALAIVLGSTAVAVAQPVMTYSSDPHPGIHRETWKDVSVPVTIRLIRIDLTRAEIEVLATTPSEAGQKTSDYAAHVGAQVALDGDMFDPSGYRPEGLAMGNAIAWPNTQIDPASAMFHFARVADHTDATIEPPQAISKLTDLPPGTQGVISGRPLLISNGIPSTFFDCNDAVTLPCDLAPRSAIALTEDRNTLILAAVDGWSASSYGATDAMLAAFLASAQIGAYSAVATNGGGASTLVVDGSVINTPSDGAERTIANHLAIKYGALPSLELVGLICASDLNQCMGGINVIVGATVTLDDGSVQISSSSGLYDFHGVAPRLACVTATKTGYYPGSRCVYVTAETQPTYGSMQLLPCPTSGCLAMPDAGIPDAAPLGMPDAPPVPDGGPDGGSHLMGPPGGGCCDAGDEPPPLALGLALATLLRQRRGTTSRPVST